MRILKPARINIVDGRPISADYGDVYASADGALGQACHVFLDGNDLPRRWAGREQFVVFETGFGLGVNFLATWAAWRRDPERPRTLHFVSVEGHPATAHQLIEHAPVGLRDLARELAEAWPLPVAGQHRCQFAGGDVRLTLVFGDVLEVMADLMVGADAFFLDGFSPDRNPAMWQPGVLKVLTRLARPGATLATWSTARAVRDALSAGGFELSLSSGFGRKRHMLRGRFAPRWRIRRHEPPAACVGPRSVMIIGSGIAGASCARSFADRGWDVQMLEQGASIAGAASSLPWGLIHTRMAGDRDPIARLTFAGERAARALLTRLSPDGWFEGSRLWQNTGVFQQADSMDESERWRQLAESTVLPASLARYVSSERAETLVGVRPRRDGWWLPHGMTVATPIWCRALLTHSAVRLQTGAEVASLDRESGRWRAHDRQGRCLATAAVVVIAAAMQSARLLGIRHAPMAAVAGLVSWLPTEAVPGLRAGMVGDGYLVPAPDGRTAVGASYQVIDGTEADIDESAAHAENMARLERLLTMPASVRATAAFVGVRAVAQDRLPYAGPVVDESACRDRKLALAGAQFADLPRLPDLYASFALGSRGLVMAPLIAEWIAALAEGEPSPIGRELAARIDVGRYPLRALRKRPDTV